MEITKENLEKTGFKKIPGFAKLYYKGTCNILFDGKSVNINNVICETFEEFSKEYEIWKSTRIETLGNVIAKLQNELNELRYGI